VKFGAKIKLLGVSGKSIQEQEVRGKEGVGD
jgi:hypothetical protein